MDSSIIIIIFLLLFCVLAVSLNGITLVSILASRTLRKTPHVFTFSVALADFVSAFVSALQIWFKGQQDVVVVVYGLMVAAILTSILSSLAVAFHRLILIRLSPFNCKRVVTAPRCIAVSVSIWLAVFAVFLVFLFSDKYHVFVTFIQPILNLSAITVCGLCYIIVYKTLNNSTRDLRLSSDAHLRRVAQNKRVLCTFALVVGSNIACWSLYCAWRLIHIAPHVIILEYDPLTLVPWAHTMGYTSWFLVNINAVINPILYWTRLSDFRRILLSCCGRGGSTSSPSTAETHIEDGHKGKRNLTLSKLPSAMNEDQKEGYKVEV